MTDYLIKEDVFMALTGDITDCTIEEFIARLRDRLVKLPVKELPKAEVSLVNYSQDLVKDILSKAELVIDEDGKMIECVRVKHIIDALGYAPDKNVATNDLISRQAAINCVTFNEVRYKMVEDIKALPCVTPKEKTGHWIDDEFGSKCSCCGIHTHLDKFDRPMKFEYCSICGAKMIKSQESEDME